MSILKKFKARNRYDSRQDREYEDLGYNLKTTPGATGESSARDGDTQADNLPISSDGIYENFGSDDESLADESIIRSFEGYEDGLKARLEVLDESDDDEQDEIVR